MPWNLLPRKEGSVYRLYCLEKKKKKKNWPTCTAQSRIFLKFIENRDPLFVHVPSASSRSQPELLAGGSFSATLTWFGWVALGSPVTVLRHRRSHMHSLHISWGTGHYPNIWCAWTVTSCFEHLVCISWSPDNIPLRGTRWFFFFFFKGWCQ